jgi:hypothetical protein
MMTEALEIVGGPVCAALYGLVAGITWGRVGTWMERVQWHTLRHHSDYNRRGQIRCERCARVPLICAILWPIFAPACEGVQFATRRRYTPNEALDVKIAELEQELGLDDD